MAKSTGVHYKWTPERLARLQKIYEKAEGDIQRTALLYGLNTDRIRRGLVKLGVLNRMYNKKITKYRGEGENNGNKTSKFKRDNNLSKLRQRNT